MLNKKDQKEKKIMKCSRKPKKSQENNPNPNYVPPSIQTGARPPRQSSDN